MKYTEILHFKKKRIKLINKMNHKIMMMLKRKLNT